MKASLMGLLLLAPLCGVGAQVQTAARKQAKTDAPNDVPTVSYCDLVRDPRLYEGKQVRVAATWNYGFEWSFLYDRACMDVENRAWVEFVKEEEGCAQSNKVSKKLKHGFNRKADVSVVGTLQRGGGYGHLNAYRYQFVVTCLEAAKQINEDAP